MAKMFGCSHIIGHSLVRRFEQTGMSVDAQNRRHVRKQRQDKTELPPELFCQTSFWQNDLALSKT